MSNGLATNNIKRKVFPYMQQVWEVTMLTEVAGSGYLGTVRALRSADLLSKEIQIISQIIYEISVVILAKFGAVKRILTKNETVYIRHNLSFDYPC